MENLYSKGDSLFVPTYGREGLPMVSGKGCYLKDSSGKEYLDFVSGIAVNALGYGNKDIEAALCEQGTKLLHSSNLWLNDSQMKLADKLLETSFADKVFFCNSGTEANEAAIKFSKKWSTSSNPSKSAILSFYDGFHGRTIGAMTATAQKRFHAGFYPLPQGYFYAPFNDIEATKQVLEMADFAAIIVEPIQGEGGVNVADKEFLQFLREYATENSIALIFDEVQCGMGRTGSLWAYEQYGVVPDILTTAKPLGGGLPLGAVLVKEEIANIMKPGDHGTTFGGNPLACAIGKVVLDKVSDKELLSHVTEMSEYLVSELTKVIDGKEGIEGVVGTGLLLGVRFKEDPKKVITKSQELGLLLVKAGKNTVRFIPPLIVTKEEIDTAISIFSQVI